MELFFQHKRLILRILGIVLLLVSLTLYFWISPKEGLSENEKAAQRIARMEAVVKGKSGVSTNSKQKDDSKFVQALKDTQAKQVQYMMILIMVFGAGFLVYSFLPKKEKTS